MSLDEPIDERLDTLLPIGGQLGDCRRWQRCTEVASFPTEALMNRWAEQGAGEPSIGRLPSDQWFVFVSDVCVTRPQRSIFAGEFRQHPRATANRPKEPGGELARIGVVRIRGAGSRFADRRDQLARRDITTGSLLDRTDGEIA